MKFNKREIPKGDSNGGMFLKLADGESRTGVFRGEVFEFYNRWVGGKSEIVGPDDEGAKPRFKLNFVTQEDGKFVAKVWEFPLTVYNQLADIAEEYPLETTKVKITRRGTGTDTIYMILPLLKEPLPPKILKEIEAIPMNILQPKVVAKASGDELPF